MCYLICLGFFFFPPNDFFNCHFNQCKNTLVIAAFLDTDCMIKKPLCFKKRLCKEIEK